MHMSKKFSLHVKVEMKGNTSMLPALCGCSKMKETEHIFSLGVEPHSRQCYLQLSFRRNFIASN